MPNSHTIKHGDTLPVLTAVLYRDENLTQPVDLTSSTQVKIKVRATGGEALLLDKVMTIVEPKTQGRVTYAFVAEDWLPVAVPPGNHNMEFEVTWGTGDVSTYPKVGYAQLIVEDDLD